MNSFRPQKAIHYEIHATAALKSGEHIVQATRLWDADREVTRSMRSKEYAHDYRYFSDPDLLPLVIAYEWIDRITATLPELPPARRDRLVRDYGLPVYDAEVLTARKDVAGVYEAAVRAYPAAPKAISNWVMDSVLRILKMKN